jgi:hypothetical protein
MARRLLWALLLVGGCGPIEYISHSTMQATHAVEEAQKARAEQFAPYEYTHAVEYLHKSREMAGFSQWQLAVEYAKRSATMGRRAHELAEARATGIAPAVQPLRNRPVEERLE